MYIVSVQDTIQEKPPPSPTKKPPTTGIWLEFYKFWRKTSPDIWPTIWPLYQRNISHYGLKLKDCLQRFTDIHKNYSWEK